VANPNVPAGPAAEIPKPTLPTIPPAIAALPPPAPVPAPRPQPIPVVPLVADAKGISIPIPGGLRVTFGPDSSDLNPRTDAALRELAATLKPQDTTTITINAYAAGSPEDASIARRLSLARALAARAVLINAGIPSTRIYPRALGSAAGDEAKDRVDVMAGPPGPPSTIAPAHLPPPPDQKAPAK
jgi:outer membrane protein OmpA-like peptidoglycan-associated protein